MPDTVDNSPGTRGTQGNTALRVHVTNPQATSGNSYGAPNGATGRINASDTAPTAVVATRTTRRSVLLVNEDTTNSARWGFGTPPTLANAQANGAFLPPRSSVTIETTAALWAVGIGGTVPMSYAEVWDNA